MLNLHSAAVSMLIFLMAAVTGCKPDAPRTPSPEADTRLWVKEAYTRINVMELPVAFNTSRARIIRMQLDQERNTVRRVNLSVEYAFELLKSGDTGQALQVLNGIADFIESNNLPVNPETKLHFYTMFGIAYLRLGEVENCLQRHNHESCFLPISGDGIHELPFGSRNAIRYYEDALQEFPNDLETRYLLNLAYMTLGEYPGQVPERFRIPPAWFESKIAFPEYKDVAVDLGLNRQSLAGGVVVDDFNNDGWPDIVVTSWSPEQELVLYENNGDGTFTDKTEAWNLKGHVGILNLNQTDFNNDGWLDLFLMRGAWYQQQGDIPNTLLMNTGKGYFADVTLKAGLTHHAPTQTSAWADFNLDGWLDLVIANESLPGYERGIDLYINRKNGSFSHESASWGLTRNDFFKGCTATDADNDGYPDIYLSALAGPNVLLINQAGSGSNTFRQAGADAGISRPFQSFPCFSFDFDNDGREDVFVSSYTNEGAPAAWWMQSQTGDADPAMLPRLYRNKGRSTYEDVGAEMGLTEVAFTMGCNFGDINTDGFLDFYLATGNPLYESIVPNKMYLNMDGRRFEDVSYAGGFANIQKGHGVGFGDLDHDGDEDLYVVIGGAFDGDGYFNCLFENPNPDQNNWIVLKLKGTKANRSAIGARVAIAVQEDGRERMIYRTVTSGASFGANSLALEVGLRKATAVRKVIVKWPCKDCPDQEFTGMEINRAYELVQDEGKAGSKEKTTVTEGHLSSFEGGWGSEKAEIQSKAEELDYRMVQMRRGNEEHRHHGHHH